MMTLTARQIRQIHKQVKNYEAVSATIGWGSDDELVLNLRNSKNTIYRVVRINEKGQVVLIQAQ